MKMGKALLIPFTLSWFFIAENCIAEDILIPPEIKRQKLKSIQSNKKINRKIRPLPVHAQPNYSQKIRDKKRKERLKKAAWSTNRLRWIFTNNLILSQTSATDRRESYTTDPTLHLSAVYLRDQGDLIGARLLPMSGYGVHKSVSGRFAFTYLGLDYGFIWLDTLPSDRAMWERDNPSKPYPYREADFLRGGVAIGSKIGWVEKGINPASTDFETSEGLFPTPAIWAEYRHTDLHLNRIGFDYSIGLMATGTVNWVWISAGISMWGES